MKENVERVVVRYYDERGQEVSSRHDSAKTRLSIYVDQRDDNHHIEFLSDVSRYELSGLLIHLAHRLVQKI